MDGRKGKILDETGRWMHDYGEAAVYGTRLEPSVCSAGTSKGPTFHPGMWTCKGNKACFAIFYYPGESLVVSKIAPRIRAARLLPQGEELPVREISNGRTLISDLPPDPRTRRHPSSRSSSKGRRMPSPNSMHHG